MMAFGLSCLGAVWAILSITATLLACIGFYMPYWLVGTIHDASGESYPTQLGLFRRCRFRAVVDGRGVDMVDACGRYTAFGDIPSSWWQLATVMVGVGAGIMLLVTVVAVTGCCLRHVITSASARLGGLLQLLAGTLLGAGCLLYPLGWDNSDVKQACGRHAHIYQPGVCKLSWAYFVTIASTAAIFLSVLLSCHAARRTPAHPQPRL